MLKFIVHSSIKKYYLHNFRHHNYYNSHDDNRNFLIKFTKFHDHSQHSLSFCLFHFAFCFCSISLLHLCNPQSRKLEMNGCFWSNCFSNRTIKLSISEEFLDLRRLSKTLCSSCYLNTQLFAVRIADKGGINGENNSSRLEFRLHTFLFFSLSPYIYIYLPPWPPFPLFHRHARVCEGALPWPPSLISRLGEKNVCHRPRVLVALSWFTRELCERKVRVRVEAFACILMYAVCRRTRVWRGVIIFHTFISLFSLPLPLFFVFFFFFLLTLSLFLIISLKQ